ncbi:DNA phosphorothioation-associated putative methyltransferase, partial [Mastigocoleus sp. MO_188.B34]|uniref:DNA phosphorothioation-associated putative methyltransferase n=1 Tax=Mastigocoleus sp. MO_188.B34 TaxID=3036635 RepID=UPI002629D7B6
MDLPETAVNIDGTKIVDLCQNSKVGKLLPSALYVHIKAIAAIDPILQKYERRARSAKIDLQTATIVKFSFDGAKISYLCYPEFDRDPHPALKHSIIIDLNTLEAKKWDYTKTNNPPILHRKETFVTPDYPSYQEFAELTKNEVALGLLDDARFIGNRNEWEYRLKRRGISFEGHRLICPIDPQKNNKIDIRIERHKAAIVRKELSRPVRLAKEAGLFTAGITFFDYGCGYGGDVERIAKQGYQSSGWDPYYFPDNPLNNADLVNIGYVINVIEDLQERQKALQQAWELADRILVIAAQVLIDDRHRGIVVYGDGIITSRNTFQKYYHQEELKIYIDRVLNVDSIPAGLGIYFAFKDEAIAQNYRVSRFHSRESTPRVKSQGKKFEEYREILTPLMDF